MPYYLLYSPKTWLILIAVVVAFSLLRKRISFKTVQFADAFSLGSRRRLEKKELKSLEKEALKGDIEAQMLLGDAYYTGNGVKRDQTKGLEWLMKAATQGKAEACLKVGDAYSKGAYSKDVVFDDRDAMPDKNDISRNDTESIRWYIKAAQNGLPRAQKRLLDMEKKIQEALLAPCPGDDVKIADVACGEAPNDYTVHLTAQSLQIFKSASEDPSISKKKGENFVSAIIKAGGILKVERRKGSWLCDGMNDEPAVQVFSPEGALVCSMHYKDNKLHDSAKGEPAFQLFNDKGQPLRISHFRNGLHHDSADGEASFLLFNEGGALIWVVHYKDGDVVKGLNDREIAEYFETSKIAKKIETAIPGLKIH